MWLVWPAVGTSQLLTRLTRLLLLLLPKNAARGRHTCHRLGRRSKHFFSRCYSSFFFLVYIFQGTRTLFIIAQVWVLSLFSCLGFQLLCLWSRSIFFKLCLEAKHNTDTDMKELSEGTDWKSALFEGPWNCLEGKSMIITWKNLMNEEWKWISEQTCVYVLFSLCLLHFILTLEVFFSCW